MLAQQQQQPLQLEKQQGAAVPRKSKQQAVGAPAAAGGVLATAVAVATVSACSRVGLLVWDGVFYSTQAAVASEEDRG